jgi:hypothetical protein
MFHKYHIMQSFDLKSNADLRLVRPQAAPDFLQIEELKRVYQFPSCVRSVSCLLLAFDTRIRPCITKISESSAYVAGAPD